MRRARPSECLTAVSGSSSQRENRANQGRPAPKRPQEGRGDARPVEQDPDSASQAAEVLRSLGCALLHVWYLGQDRSSRNVWAPPRPPQAGTAWCPPENLHVCTATWGAPQPGVSPAPSSFSGPGGSSSPFLCPIGHTSSASLACQPTNWSNHPLAGFWGTSSPTEVTMTPGPLNCGHIATHTSLGQGGFCTLVDITHHLHLGGRHLISATPILMLCVCIVPALRAQELRVPAVPPLLS